MLDDKEAKLTFAGGKTVPTGSTGIVNEVIVAGSADCEFWYKVIMSLVQIKFVLTVARRSPMVL